MISRARQVILLADRSKFEKTFLHKVCDITDFDVIITDTQPDDTVMKKIIENNIHLIVTELEGESE
ncbi:DeoR/GlpR family transcriptional regulator of sugar metabolism [Bacillus sp. OAE603]